MQYSQTGDDILTMFIGHQYYHTYWYYCPALDAVYSIAKAEKLEKVEILSSSLKVASSFFIYLFLFMPANWWCIQSSQWSHAVNSCLAAFWTYIPLVVSQMVHGGSSSSHSVCVWKQFYRFHSILEWRNVSAGKFTLWKKWEHFEIYASSNVSGC